MSDYDNEASGPMGIGDICEDDCTTELKLGCCGCWSVMIVILSIILIACSVETIDSTEMGIAYNAPQAILDSVLFLVGFRLLSL